jgi:hypothetical protein
MQNGPVVKKFYRDLNDEENAYIQRLLAGMRTAPIVFPSHVIQRMISRGIIERSLIQFDDEGEILNYRTLNAIPGYQNALKAFDDGHIYEISNEGLGKTKNPFRIVLSKELGDGFTYFVKITPLSDKEIEDHEVRILDVWRKIGKTPIYPPKHSIDQFTVDWDIMETFDAFFYDVHDEDEDDDDLDFQEDSDEVFLSA